MIYEANRKLDPGTAKQIIGFMDERDRRRKKILRTFHSRNSSSFLNLKFSRYL